MLYGVDVHDGYQAGLSFPTLARQGYTFAAVKLTQGAGYVRGAAGDWIRAARSAGLIPGAYHWLTAGDGAAQARWFHRHVTAAGGPDGMLIQLDCEDDGYGPQMRAWADEWNRLTGGHPFLVYSGAWWWPRTGGYWGADLTPHVWHSHYLTADTDSVPDDPAALAARIPASWWTPGYGGWPEATILQFTSKGDAGGLENKVDLNVTRMTREQLLALTHVPGRAQPAVEAPDMTPEQETMLKAMAWRTEAIVQNLAVVRDGPTKGERNELHFATESVQAQMSAALTALGAIGTATPEVAAILSGLDDRLAALRAEVRDAVADLGEGGAAQVRADAG